TVVRFTVCEHIGADSSLTAVRANYGERRRTGDRAVKVDLYSRRTSANDRYTLQANSKTVARKGRQNIWLRRYEQLGAEGVRDRSQRPLVGPSATKAQVGGTRPYLRQNCHFGPARIALYL